MRIYVWYTHIYTCLCMAHSTRCNTLQHTTTHCNTLQHTATRCNTRQHSMYGTYVCVHTHMCVCTHKCFSNSANQNEPSPPTIHTWVCVCVYLIAIVCTWCVHVCTHKCLPKYAHHTHTTYIYDDMCVHTHQFLPNSAHSQIRRHSPYFSYVCVYINHIYSIYVVYECVYTSVHTHKYRVYTHTNMFVWHIHQCLGICVSWEATRYLFVVGSHKCIHTVFVCLGKPHGICLSWEATSAYTQYLCVLGSHWCLHTVFVCVCILQYAYKS